MSNLIYQQIVEIAKQRIGFKIHIAAYIITNIIIWLTWATAIKNYGNHNWLIIWPLWTTIAWGIGGIFVHYMSVYHKDKFISADKEVERLKNRS
jgi:hypothetical protein